MRGVFSGIALALMLVVSGAGAVEPDEMLADPALEERARNLSTQIRCLVCQNQNIDDSNADFAKELRLLVRERIENGDTDREVLDYLVARYGDFVLLKPRFTATTAILWIAPAALVIGGGILAIVVIRRRAASGPTAELSPEEEERLKRLLGENPSG